MSSYNPAKHHRCFAEPSTEPVAEPSTPAVTKCPLCVFVELIPGGPSVPVHPGLQSYIQAVLGAALTGALAEPGREGPLGAQHGAGGPEEGHRLRDQGAAVLQRVPGHGQRVADGAHHRRR